MFFQTHHPSHFPTPTCCKSLKGRSLATAARACSRWSSEWPGQMTRLPMVGSFNMSAHMEITRKCLRLCLHGTHMRSLPEATQERPSHLHRAVPRDQNSWTRMPGWTRRRLLQVVSSQPADGPTSKEFTWYTLILYSTVYKCVFVCLCGIFICLFLTNLLFLLIAPVLVV